MNKETTLPPKETNLAIHPILFGLYPATYLFHHNINELSASQAVRAFVACLILSITVWLTIKFVLRFRKNQAALLTSFTLLTFFMYGHIYTYLFQLNIRGWVLFGIKVGVNTYLLPFWVITLCMTAYLIAKKGSTCVTFTKVLNIISIVLIGILSLNILRFQLKQPAYLNQEAVPASPQSVLTDNKPDIYYIILDEYPRADILQEVLNYDNTKFISALENLGFKVPTKSRSNYCNTTLSIPSTMNMDFVHEPYNTTKGLGIDIAKQGAKKSRLLQYLKALDYYSYSFKTGYIPTEFSDSIYIDQYLAANKTAVKTENLGLFGNLNPFEFQLVRTTPLLVFSLISDYLQQHRNNLLFTMENLSKIEPKSKKPIFVFAHLLCPHVPFVFDRQGKYISITSSIENLLTVDSNLKEKPENIQEYATHFRDQLIYLNKRILQSVTEILKRAKRPTVIIIQSDHGERFLAPIWLGRKNKHHTKTLNFNAIYFPDQQYDDISDDLNNVNTFRIVINHFLNGTFKMLPKQSYANIDNIFQPIKNNE